VKVLRGDHHAWEPAVGPMAVTIGVYDGVHIGHLAVFDALRQSAGGLPVGVVTFDPHPVAVLAPERVPPLLTSTEQRLEAFAAAGVDVVGVLDFDAHLASMSAEDFLTEVVAGAMAASFVAVGSDFRFGSGRRGDLAMLERLGPSLGLEVVGLDLRQHGGVAVSSSRIRGLIANGDVRRAADLLGRRFVVRGPVIRGDGRGLSHGIEIATVAIDENLVRPARGVYAVVANVDGAAFSGVANLGVRPTFGPSEDLTLEVHFFDLARDLTGVTIDIAFVERIRNEKRFHGPEDLIAQIKSDIQRARAVLGE